VLRRKAEANLELLTATPLNLLVPLLLAAAVVVVLRPARLGPGPAAALEQVPALRWGLLASLLTAAVGAVANDSGVAVVATVLLVAAPLGIAGALSAPPPPAAAAEHRRAGPGAADPVLPSTPVDGRASPAGRSGEHAPRRHGEVPR
jgi:hypothetical protein